MEGLSALKDSVVQLLKGYYRFSGIDIIGEYPAIIRNYPLEKPCIAVGVDSVEMNASLGGFIGSAANGDVYGQLLSITMRLDVFAPALKPCDPHSIAEAVYEILMLSANGIGFTRLWSDDVSYDKYAEANRLTIKASLKAALTLEDNSPAVEAFRLELRKPAQ